MSALNIPPLPSVSLRPPCSSASGYLPAPVPMDPPFIQFRHPGYPPGYDLMFRLSAFDTSTPLSDADNRISPLLPQWGIHHATALHACRIIACNSDGFLSTVRLPTPVDMPLPIPQDVLTEPSYWFYPCGWSPSDEPYAVCPDFDSWEFPADSIPTDWLAIAVCIRINQSPFRFLHQPTQD